MRSRGLGSISTAHPVFGEAGAGLDAVGPPYQVTCRDFMFLLTEFDPDAARLALPSTHRFLPDQPGFICLYTAPVGWGLAPYGSFFVAIPVRGHDSPDGSCGYFMAEGIYSNRAGDVLPRFYNARLRKGEVRQWREGSVLIGEAGPPDAPVARMRFRPVEPRPQVQLMAGVHNYLGELPDGTLTIYPIAYSGEFYPVEDVDIEFTEHASPLLRSLAPIAVPLASYLPIVPVTIPPPRPISASPVEIAVEGARVGLIDLIGRLGRPAALIARDGHVVFLNQQAETLLAGHVRHGQLRLGRASEQQALREALSRVVGEGLAALPEPMAIAEPGSQRPVLVQALPVAAALAGQPAALVLFGDPLGQNGTDPAAMLELFGLTPAEARMAAAIGGGRSARQTADALQLSVNTVHSTLRVIYDKLNIGKQSELARIVARLDGFGSPLSRTEAV